MGDLLGLKGYYGAEKTRFLAEWSEWLRFKSISTDPAFDDDCRRCAEWTKGHLQGIGLDARLLDTPSKPVVYGHFKGPAAGPHILYYGHYDVQPVDPLELWTSGPFEPELRDGRLYARGAADNKGQSFYFLKALERAIKVGEMKASVTVLLEGEEESGSEGISSQLPKWRDLIKADVLMVCDTGGLAPRVPFITMGLRGLVGLEFTLGGLHNDLHSGALGGVVRNPATELARMIASLHDAQGRIAIPGYYDEVVEFSAEDRALANAPWPPSEVFKRMVGVEACGGEQGIAPAERRGMRPTIEVNGMYSGYQGAGGKTIIPAVATCKLTSRLVATQNPARCLELLVAFLRSKAPAGLEFEIKSQQVGGGAIALSSKEPIIARARKVLDEVAGMPTQFTWEGGSIPVVEKLVEYSGAKPLLVGFALEEDKAHAPNESFALEQFELGFLYAARMLQELSAK